MLESALRRGISVPLLLCLLFPGPALAEAGKILFVRGEVAIVDESGDRVSADAGTVVEKGDRIRTGGDSRAQLRLSDGALISLRSHSDYQILAQNTEDGLMEQAGKLFSGWMRTVTGAIGEENPEAIEQETPVATIGIRGTTYQIIHMPKGGIPGMPESEPGTYIYLQQGRIETTAGGETRFMEPGDVVFVPMGGGVPVPAPDKKSLFSRGEGRAVQGASNELLKTPGGDELGDRDDLESTDALNDGLAESLVSPRAFPDPGTKTHFYGSDGTEFVAEDPASLLVEPVDSQNALVYAEGNASTLGTVGISANSGATPGDRGSFVLPSGDDVINWGVWSQGDYTVVTNPDSGAFPATTTGPWHYMIGSNTIQSYTELANMGLSGQWNYGYKGGTTLRGAFGGTTLEITSGNILVDFDSMGLDVTLSASNGNTYTSGAFTINDLYNNSVNLGNGDMTGYFTGDNADGIITTVTLEGNTGTAAFGQDGTSSQTVSAP